jgi:pimeloyl-ACP methyl ester carboxylesterase
MEAFTITSADGVELAATIHGQGPLALLFVHGFNQSQLAWVKQVADPKLLEQCRLVTFDLRGHGASSKPVDAAAYNDPALWAADIDAVMQAAGLVKPIMVGWSYAGRVITDYIRGRGTDRLGGINFIGAVLKADGKMMGHGRKHFVPMLSTDIATNIGGTRAFLRACFECEPPRDDFETMLAYNMMVPPIVRKRLLDRSNDPAEVLPSISCPVLLTHGEKDQVILAAMSRYAAGQIPGAQLSIYDRCGHSPFYEDPARFNTELLAFARTASG